MIKKPKPILTYRIPRKNTGTGRIVLYSALVVILTAAVLWTSFIKDTTSDNKTAGTELKKKDVAALNTQNYKPRTAADRQTSNPNNKTSTPPTTKTPPAISTNPPQTNEKPDKSKPDKIIYDDGTLTNSTDLEHSRTKSSAEDDQQKKTATENDSENSIKREIPDIPEGAKTFKFGSCIAVEAPDGSITIYNDSSPPPLPPAASPKTENNAARLAHLADEVRGLKQQISHLRSLRSGGSAPDTEERIRELEQQVDDNYAEISNLQLGYGVGYNGGYYPVNGYVPGHGYHNLPPQDRDSRPPKKPPVYRNRLTRREPLHNSFTGSSVPVSPVNRSPVYNPVNVTPRTPNISQSNSGTRSNLNNRRSSGTHSTLVSRGASGSGRRGIGVRTSTSSRNPKSRRTSGGLGGKRK